jgi:hypothetical protein
MYILAVVAVTVVVLVVAVAVAVLRLSRCGHAQQYDTGKDCK